MDHTIAKN